MCLPLIRCLRTLRRSYAGVILQPSTQRKLFAHHTCVGSDTKTSEWGTAARSLGTQCLARAFVKGQQWIQVYIVAFCFCEGDGDPIAKLRTSAAMFLADVPDLSQPVAGKSWASDPIATRLLAVCATEDGLLVTPTPVCALVAPAVGAGPPTTPQTRAYAKFWAPPPPITAQPCPPVKGATSRGKPSRYPLRESRAPQPPDSVSPKTTRIAPLGLHPSDPPKPCTATHSTQTEEFNGLQQVSSRSTSFRTGARAVIRAHRI